ncbi:phage/plasmid replication protein [Brevibacillus sp. MER 51]|uniref:phage/plasmid replication domain-containing protein n=1 Tax=Brevibacillus sp. MER 51 TaxID=2939560 RepID=UPI00203C5215|nr:phage/plasmid replication protein [Brevibacillus sp. MER 51]MCM3143915.1 hypothetical protein [Brevibacillus sp. MER 51]
MIHTANFYLTLSEEEIGLLCGKFKVEISLLSKKVDRQFDGMFKTTFTRRFGTWWMFLKVDFTIMLDKADIVETDLPNIKRSITQYLFFLFGDNDKELTMTRLDYCYNAVVKDVEQRKLLLWLLKKTADKYNRKKKNRKFKTSIYFNSLSVKILLYDKIVEREDKLLDARPYEENVIRLEVSLQNRHFNYMKKYHGITKKFENYFTKDFWEKYMVNHVSPIFHQGDFYKIDQATKIIGENDIKEKHKINLREFLRDVSIYNFEGIKKIQRVTAKGKQTPKYSKYKVKQFIEFLEGMGIHPIPIPKHKLGNKKYMENPFRF